MTYALWKHWKPEIITQITGAWDWSHSLFSAETLRRYFSVWEHWPGGPSQVDVTLQVFRRENVIFDGEGKKEGKERLKESFWTNIPSWIFMKTKESGNTEACFKLSSLNPRWLFFSRKSEDAPVCLLAWIFCFNFKSRKMDPSFSLCPQSAPCLMHIKPSFLLATIPPAKQATKNMSSEVSLWSKTHFHNLLTMGSWAHYLIFLSCHDNEMNHHRQVLSTAQNFYILSNIHSVLHHSSHYSDFVISLGFFPPFVDRLFVSLCSLPLTTDNYFFFLDSSSKLKKKGNRKVLSSTWIL